MPLLNIDIMEKYELEFPFNTSSSLLYKRISTPSGLSEWFADDVFVKKDKFTFVWEDYKQVAYLIESKKNERVRFCWEDNDDENYFEFIIRSNSLTGDNALVIVDFAEDDDDKEDAINLWEKQVSKLQSILGS